ncbi:Skt5p [Rhizophagus irregularis DAOM 197198w]|uniref:Skt5p n=1 Tax=Rhizophagus irregularis (strain DAOM 197198w) TaxID=1432141 RepID=A0A015JV57_RHIIW|nr:Skt5p [Rhizophagus irregularis DAOM 197198w]
MSTEEWIEKCIREEHIKYYEFSEFSEIREIGNELFGKMYKANWKQSEKCIVLRSFNLDHATVKEIIREIKLRREVDFNDMMMKFYGITKTSDKKYLLVLEYAEGGTLRNYLKEEFTSLDWQDKYRLAFQLSSAIEYLHEKETIHEDLNSNNISIQQNSIKLADFGLSKRIKSTDQISFDTVPYDAPEGFNITGGNLQDVNRENKQTEKLKKSDVYSTGVLLWELSSGKRPFADKEYNISLARKISQGLREGIVEGTPKEYSNLYAKCWDSDPGKRPTIQEVTIILKSMISSQQTQQVIKQLKLNHGLFLDGYRIEPSKQAVLSENGILNISLYREQPLIYTYVNNHGSLTNLLSFDDNNELNEALQPSDICINFPVAEITYNANLLESFSNFMNGDETLYETYGHLFARKLLVGGTLFIDDFKSITSKQQIDSFKFLLTWVYNSVKYNKEIPFNNLSSLNFFPKLRTSGGKKLLAPVDLINWMNKLYQDNMLDIISYTNLILISELRLGKSSSIDAFQEKQPGIANFKEKLSLKDWVGDSICVIYVNLARWVKEFHLLQGIIISKYLRLEISKKTAVSFVNVPSVNLSKICDISHLNMIKPTTNLEKILISNNIFPTENARDISTFPFIKGLIKEDNLNYRNYTHFLVRRERYKISLSSSSSLDIEPSEEFELAIEEAIESMRPFVFLQSVFDEYGHLFPLTIFIGKSLKNILSNSPKKIDLGSPTFESLKLHLDNLNISYLLTKKGNIVEKNDLSNWIKDDDNLEIIEFENVISLYDILEVEQRRRIDVVLNKQDEVKIIMTGIVDLEDLDNNNIEHYKRINVNPSLESENYEVFGSIISDHGLRIEDFSVTFGLYDFNGFSATIKTLNNASVNITKCYILWMIVGNPSELLVFSPKNRDIKVNYVKESIALKPDISCYSIKSCQLSEDYTIFLNYYCLTANYEPIDIKLVKWSNDSIDFQIVESNNSNSNTNESNEINEIVAIIVDVHIFILSSDYKSLKIDNDEKECNLNLIGYALTEDIYSDNSINIFINELLSFYKDCSILKEKGELIRKHIVLKKENENKIFNYLLSFKNKKQNIILLADFYKHGIGTEKDEIKAFELYKKAAEKGQIDSIYMLGKCYQNGEGTEKNLGKAFYWYQKAAENSVKEAMFNLAIFYKNGEGIEKNLEKAFYWYQKAAENGVKEAMFNLAIFYENGEGTEKNLEKAIHWYQKAAENGVKEAMFNLTIFYENGEGIEKNLEKAFYWYQKVAENGVKEAMFNLAICYKDGEGTEKNLEKAVYWYQKAAENGVKEAMFNLAIFYKNEKETVKNLKEAFYWFQNAAEKDHIKAMFNLAIFYENGEGTEKNLEKAFYWYQKAAENGNEKAMFNLANSYFNGKGIERNLEKAFYWYQKAAENGVKEVMFILAICYKDGEGIEKNLEKAFYWYQKAAENGVKEAMFNLAIFYENGVEIEQNLEVAFYWFQKAAEKGHIKAIFNLAIFYENGEKTEKNLEKAFYWYQKAAENGIKEAMFNLAIFYENGEGTEKNLEEAFYWYQKAAKKDHIKAMFNLAIFYENGEETEKSLEKAFYWYQKAAEKGYTDAMFNLAICYKNGEVIEKNLEKAFYWYQKAAENGYTDAMFNLANSYYNGEETEKNLEKAFYWYQKAAENGIKEAIFNLAIFYENGEGTEKNLKEAFYWYQKAAEKDHINAMFNLANSYYNGKGTEKNLEKAFYWYQKAAENGDESAMFNLANSYYNGKGTEKNLERAFCWFQRAAEIGVKEAMNNSAMCYENGEGTEKNLEKAFYWYQKAAESGYTNAGLNLPKYYENEKGIKEELENSYTDIKFNLANNYYGEKKAEKNLEETIYLTNSYYNGEETEKNLKETFYWYRKGAENGDERAMFNLANSYYNGKGIEKDLNKAFYWYRKAAENGNKEAINNLAMCYENGEGTEKNLEKAYYWHQKAAENRDEKTLTSNSYYNEKGKAAENSDEKTLTSNSYYNIEKMF